MASPVNSSECDVRRQVIEATASGDWNGVVQMVEGREVDAWQKTELVVEVLGHDDAGHATRRLLAGLDVHTMDQALTRLVSDGQWKAVLRLLSAAGDDRQTWTVAGVAVDRELLGVVAEAKWQDVSAFLRDSNPAVLGQQRWAALTVCTRATQRDLIRYVLPVCADWLVDDVLEQLLSWGRWWAVGSLLAQRRSVSAAVTRRAVLHAAQEATTWELSDFILPHLQDNLWPLVVPHLLQRQLWWAMAKVLCTKVQMFVGQVLPRCAVVHLDSLMTHLVSQDQWDSVQDLLYVARDKKLWTVNQVTVESKLLVFVVSQDWVNVLNMLPSMGGYQRKTPRLFDRHSEMMQNFDSPQCSWALQQVSRRAENDHIIYMTVLLCRGQAVAGVMKQLVKRGFAKYTATLLCQYVGQTALAWAEADEKGNKDEDFWNFACCRYDIEDVCSLHLCVQEDKVTYAWLKLLSSICFNENPMSFFSEVLPADATFCRILCDSVVELLTMALFCTGKQETVGGREAANEQACTVVGTIFKKTSRLRIMLDESEIGQETLLPVIRDLCMTLSPRTQDQTRSPLFGLYLLKAMLQCCYKYGQWQTYVEIFLVVLTCVPVDPIIQTVALSFMLRTGRWAVITMADLSHVGEQMRRQLLAAAVKQKRWSVVRQWLHSILYNDQRDWVLREAEKDNEKSVVQCLSGQDRARDRPDTACPQRSLEDMAQQQQWDECRQVIEHTVSMQQSQEAMKRTKRSPQTQGGSKCDELELTEQAELLQTLSTSHNRDATEYCCSENTELTEQTHNVPVQPDRSTCAEATGSSTFSELTEQDRSDSTKLTEQTQKIHQDRSEYTEMTEQDSSGSTELTDQTQKLHQDSSDCTELTRPDLGTNEDSADRRKLTEQGLQRERKPTADGNQAASVQQCASVLPQLMDGNQWPLVAKVMELHVEDGVRRHVMSRALERGEGSVVAQCIRTMQQTLSVAERDAVFQRAVVAHVLQAFHPLVEERDATGQRHRQTALQVAVLKNQWDLVDHCLLHGADINMQDSEGKTFMQKVSIGEWERIEGLLKRGCEQPPVDKDGKSLLHRAIESKQLKTVAVLIKHNADIHQHADRNESSHGEVWLHPSDPCATPIQMLCERKLWELVELASATSPRIREANREGETILHAACLYALTSCMKKLVARGVNQAAVTRRGLSVVLYAVLGTDPQQAVAECVRLGLTNLEHASGRGQGADDEARVGVRTPGSGKIDSLLMPSPVLLAAIQGLYAITQTLYEAGACSHRDLFEIKVLFYDFTLPASLRRHSKQLNYILKECDSVCERHNQYDFRERTFQYRYVHADGGNHHKLSVDRCARYLLAVLSTPRSLKSSCRLVISRCIQPGPSRDDHIQQLPVYESLKQYVLFNDLLSHSSRPGSPRDNLTTSDSWQEEL